MKIVAEESHQGILVGKKDENDIILDSSFFQNKENLIKKPLIILLHGWNNNKKELLYLIQPLLENDFNVLIYSYRGHGKSNGYRNLVEINKDIHKVIDYSIKNLPNIDEKNINLIGQSYGSGISLTEGYSNKRIKHIFALNPFFNMQVATKINRYFFTKMYLKLTKLRITEENNKLISPEFFLDENRDNSKRIFLVMTKKDSYIPFSEKQKLIDHLKLPSTNVKILKKGSHTFKGLKHEVINQIITWLKVIYA